MSSEVVKVLMTIPEVMEATGFSRSFIYKRLKTGELKSVKNGKTIRVRPRDLEDWIDIAGSR
jgi:excisionase family DNA binding protein